MRIRRKEPERRRKHKTELMTGRRIFRAKGFPPPRGACRPCAGEGGAVSQAQLAICGGIRMNIQNNGYLSIEQLTDQYLNRPKGAESREGGEHVSFQEILQRKSLESRAGIADAAGSLRFSKHALGRLSDRNIELDTEQLARLNDGAKKAGQKGIRDSLVIVDRLAFIVNVPNQTVVTAMDSTATDENIFTNINGAVIA